MKLFLYRMAKTVEITWISEKVRIMDLKLPFLHFLTEGNYLEQTRRSQEEIITATDVKDQVNI